MSITSTTYPPTTSTGAWKAFTVAGFLVAASMMAGGIYFLEARFAAKGFYAVAAIMLVHTSVSIAKTPLDEEASRTIVPTEDARTGRLLTNINRGET